MAGDTGTSGWQGGFSDHARWLERGFLAVRILICVMVAAAVATALLLFDDIERALPIVNLVVWGGVITVGILLTLRVHARPRHRAGRRRHEKTARERHRTISLSNQVTALPRN